MAKRPDIDPLEYDLNKSVQSGQESMTPALKYFTVVVHHSAEVDPINIFKNEATAIKLRSWMSPKVKQPGC
jgi:hypothetical protein